MSVWFCLMNLILSKRQYHAKTPGSPVLRLRAFGTPWHMQFRIKPQMYTYDWLGLLYFFLGGGGVYVLCNFWGIMYSDMTDLGMKVDQTIYKGI